MRGDQRPRAALKKVVRHGHGQRRALFGIGRGAQLIEQHQRTRIGQPREPVEVGDVRGKSRKRRLDRLRIANIGQERREDGKARLRRGHRNSRLRHHCQQRRGLERHGFAAGIGSADDELALVGRQFQNQRHDLPARRPQPFFQQRMARALNAATTLVQESAQRNRIRAQIAPEPGGCRPAPARARPQPGCARSRQPGG